MSHITAAEFRVRIEALGFSQDDAAAALGVTGRTVRRWIAGTTDVPEGVADELASIERETSDYVQAGISALQKQGADSGGLAWLTTYQNNEAYHTAYPKAAYPASWHRAVMGRVCAAVPWARLTYHLTGEDESLRMIEAVERFVHTRAEMRDGTPVVSTGEAWNQAGLHWWVRGKDFDLVEDLFYKAMEEAGWVRELRHPDLWFEGANHPRNAG